VKFKLTLQLFAGLSLVMLAVSHWFPLGINLLELIGAFAHFTFVGSIIIALASMILGFRLLLGFSLASTVICGILIIPACIPSKMGNQTDFTIGQFNLYHHNESAGDAIKALQLIDADVFTIQELNLEWMPLIDSAFSRSHPYRVQEHWATCCYGIGLYSKYPIVSSRILTSEETPMIESEINIGGKPLSVLSIHTLPPALPNQTLGRNRQLEYAKQVVEAFRYPHIVIGDLNLVSWDAVMARFVQDLSLKPVRNGIQSTFPAKFGMPLIPIDHILHNHQLVPASCGAFYVPGSDHKGLVASFAFQE
jgi:endonuclease/exonuclease/phosphatase (EEP) superfamily protein YafD